MRFPTRVLAVCAALVLPGSTAAAQLVTYTTTGLFSGSGSNVGLFGGTTLTFAGVSVATVNPTPFTFGSFGQIVVSSSATSGSPVSGNFTLNIFQTAPTLGSGSLIGSLSGAIGINASTALLTFGTGSVILNGVTYQLQSTSIPLVPPSTNNGVTSLQGIISLAPTTVPEPSTYALMATGLVGIAGAARRRRRAIAD